uniref:Insulin-like growth factor 2 n=1 Tax=Denticeps clupeoides TaxID=299321 RepID=A0AAY4BW38_9TELE
SSCSCHSHARKLSHTLKRKPSRGNAVVVRSSASMLMLLVALCVCVPDVGSAETLCGGELVDTLQFVCGDRGFYFSRPNRLSGRRGYGGIVEECCFRTCTLELLEQYCAKTTLTVRDLDHQVHTHTHTQSLMPARTLHLSEFNQWQRDPAQRLQRGLPTILRSQPHPHLTIKPLSQTEDSTHQRPIRVPSRRIPALHVRLTIRS